MIDCKDIEFTYDGKRAALDGASLHVNAGEFVCILGGNGSGKSTLAKHLNALLVPDKGSVTVDGLDTAEARDVYRIRSTVGMVFQNPDDQLVASLVEDDVAFGPENLGVETAELTQRVREALQEVGLVGFEKHETFALSGGQKQRVAIAGVLAMQPKVLVLDEASAMLDPRGRKGLMRVCKKLNERGMTVIMITHFMEEAAETDRACVLDRGAIVLSGTPAEVLARTDVLADLNLDVPFACDLSLKMRNLGANLPVCVREAELVEELCRLLEEKGQETPHGETETEAEETGKAGQSPLTAGSQAQGQTETPEGQNRTTVRSSSGIQRATAPVCLSAFPQDAASSNASTQGKNSPFNRQKDAVPSPSNAIMQVESVSFTYNPPSKRKRPKKGKPDAEKQTEWGNAPDAIWTLRDVDFCVREGEFFGIAGHTGSGKSTLIQHLNGILQPIEGRVFVKNCNVADKKQAARVRADVGMVFQYPEHQLFADTVYNDVAFGPRNMGLSETEVDARVHEALELVHLDFGEVNATSPFALSGGQQRRVAFAGVLAMRPEILVLDEPMAGLDPAARRDFLALVAELHGAGRTVVMVSHNMDDLAQLCDRLLVLNEGRVFALGTPSEVFLKARELNEIGLGVPVAQHVANSLRERGIPLSEDVLFDGDSLARALSRMAELAGAAR